MPLTNAALFKQVLTFHRVARFGSVSLAADSLHLTQSAVSIQISSLEEAVGAPLLQRTGRGVRLTDAGVALLGYSERLLALWEETSDSMSSFLGQFSGVLRIGAVSTAEYWLATLLVTFVNENPKVKIKLHSANRAEIVRSLAAHEVDIAIIGAPPEDFKTASFSFAKSPMAFMAAPDHPLMSVPQLSMATLADSSLMVRERGSGSRATLTRLFREQGLELVIGWELASNEVIKQMCIAGFGPAYLSMHTVVLELEAGLLKLLPLELNPIIREWHVVHLPTADLPVVALAFETFLRERGQTEIDQLLARRAAAIHRQ